MNKKKQNPIAKNLDKIIKEANLHSEKKLKGRSLSRFTATSMPLDINSNTKKVAAPKTSNSSDKGTHAQKRSSKRMPNDVAIKQTKAVNSTKTKETTSHKKQRKVICKKDSFAPQSTVASIIDKRIDIKKLRGKSILCTGGVRSGKSDLALAWANMFEGNKAFIATMQTPKDFRLKENTIGKNNNSKITPYTQQGAGKNTDKNSEQDNYDIPPRSLQSDRVKDMYRIHTRLDDESSHLSYYSHVSSKFIENEEEYIQDGFTKGKHKNDEHNNHNLKEKNTKKNSCCEEQKNHAFISNVIKDMKNKNLHKHMELENRISKHQAQRGQSWITIEEPIDIISALHKAKEEKCCVAIIDCITLWLTNLILQEKTDKQILNKVEELANLLKKPPIPLAIVTNEIGAGIVPNNSLARRFRDLQGKANQILAKDSSTVVISFCGLPLLLKG